MKQLLVVLLSQVELRSNISLCDAGAVYKYDLSLPPDDMYKLVEETRERMKQLPVTVVGYGHMGDSNLHLNISAGQPGHKPAALHFDCDHLRVMVAHFVASVALPQPNFSI